MIKYSWNIEERHMSLVNGQTYYISVSAFDLTGVVGENITSKGTMIDVIPPNVTKAEVSLLIDLDGTYSIEWNGFTSMSGMRDYEILLNRDSKPFNLTKVPGDMKKIKGVMSEEDIGNGTIFDAKVKGWSMSGLSSPDVTSIPVMPRPASRAHASRVVIGTAIGIALGCLLSAGIVAIFVTKYVRQQRKKAKERDWLRKLNSSVYAYLQGSGTSRGDSGFSDEGSLSSFNPQALDTDNSKDIFFVFTDIQSSTALCEEDADAYLLLQEAHDEIVRNALALTGGYEVDTEGDAFQCMFPNAVSSLLFCFKVQDLLLEYEWPASVLHLNGCKKVQSKLFRDKNIWSGPKVRMALHAGLAGTYYAKSHPTTRRVAFGGLAWETTKILSDLGHGGQIIVSEQAWKHLIDNADEGAVGYPLFEDLGLYEIDHKERRAMRILQCAPARSPVSERVFEELRDAEMLDPGKGMNIVPPMEGKVAIVSVIIEPSCYIDIIETFLTLIGKRERAANNAPDDRAEVVSVGSLSPLALPEYDIPNEDEDAAVLDKSVSRAIRGTEESQQTYFTTEHQQAVEIVSTIIESLVSQFGGYVIRTVEEVDTPPQMLLVTFKSSSSAARFTLAAQTTLMEYPWPKSINEVFGNSNASMRVTGKDGTPLFNGPSVAMAGHVDKIEKFDLFSSSLTLRCNSRSLRVTYKYSGILKALELARIANGGQTILSSAFFDSKWQKGLSLSQTQVTDLGIHDVNYFGQPVNLIEILPKVVCERSHYFAPVTSHRILSVGAQNAPGAHGDHVALVFTYPRVAHTFQKNDFSNRAVDNFSEAVRFLLPRYNGYESQEVGTGCFFLSFPNVDDAVAWSIHLQTVLRTATWNSSSVIIQKSRGDDEDGDNDVADNGSDEHIGRSSSFSSGVSDDMDSFESRIYPTMSMQMLHLVLPQIGICYGMPTKVTPHVQTGRADYFGPMVNLTARVAKRTPPGEINLNCEEFKGGSMSLRCFLKGTQVDNEGKWVDIELDDLGKKELKGVREKRRVFAVRMKEDERMSAEESLESLESISSL